MAHHLCLGFAVDGCTVEPRMLQLVGILGPPRLVSVFLDDRGEAQGGYVAGAVSGELR